MTGEFFIDDLNLEAIDYSRQPPGPALWTGTPIDDLEAVEETYRQCPISGAHRVMFSEILSDGTEIWETGDGGRQAREYQALMQWPVTPSLEQAAQWQRYTDGLAAVWAWERAVKRGVRSG